MRGDEPSPREREREVKLLGRPVRGSEVPDRTLGRVESVRIAEPPQVQVRCFQVIGMPEGAVRKARILERAQERIVLHLSVTGGAHR